MKLRTRPTEIILVDDDLDDRMLFKEAFEDLKISDKLMTFKNGLEVLEYLKSCEKIPDIIFLDLNMPLMGGFEALKNIRENNSYRDLSVAIYSTSSSETDIEAALIAGANIYIKKPDDFDKLKTAIQKVLSMNLQFTSSELSKETFMLSV